MLAPSPIAKEKCRFRLCVSRLTTVLPAETTWGIIGAKVWINKKEEVPGEAPKRPRREGGGGGRGPGGGGGGRPQRREHSNGSIPEDSRNQFKEEGDKSCPSMPKRVKFRKTHRGSRAGNASRGTKVSFGEFGLQCLGRGWITNRQIEALPIR